MRTLERRVVLLSGVQTLDVGQALFMPIGASLSLLIMFLFFDSLQLMFAVCTASVLLSVTRQSTLCLRKIRPLWHTVVSTSMN